MKKVFICGLLLVLSFVFVTAVFAADDQEDETIKLVYLSKWNVGEVTQEIINDAIEGWLIDNPGVEVERLWAGRDANTKLMAMVQSGSPPDFYDEDPLLNEAALGKNGQLLDLTPYLKSVDAYDMDKKVWDCFSQGTFEPLTFRGEINTIPIQQYLTVFWYDKTLFKQLGIAKTPDTWPEFLDLCEKIKSQGVAPIVMDGGIDFYNMYFFSHLADRIEGPNALLEAINDKTGKSWDKPGFLEAQKLVKEIVDKGYIAEGFEGYQFPAGQIDWVQRKGALLLIHTYMPIEVADAKPDDFVFGSFPFPSVPGGKGDQYELTSILGGVTILKSTKDPDLAFDLLKRLVSEETQTRFAQEALNVPAIMGVDLPDIFKDLEEIMVKQTGTFRDYAGGPGQFEPEYAQTIMFPLNEQVLFGKLSPEDFIEQLKEQSIKYWKNK